MPLLAIQNLSLDLHANDSMIRALDGLSFEIGAGESVCLVGESGSGKSLTALSIGRLLPPGLGRYSGEILLQGKDVLQMSKRDLRGIRGSVVSYIFQDPLASLNPVVPIGRQIKEALRLHRPEAATDAEVIRLLDLVGIAAPSARIRDCAHQISGGMAQRVMIAMAIASHPKLLVADEPTTALDVTIQAQILDLLRDLKKRFGMSLLLITHNLPIVRGLADRLLVMYAGQIVESGPADQILAQPAHPYTRALLAAVPELGSKKAQLAAIPGAVPRLGQWPEGCRFHPRCEFCRSNCRTEPPPLYDAGGGTSRCHYWQEVQSTPPQAGDY